MAQAFSLLGSPVTYAELTAFVLSIAMVLCNLRINPIGWPLAIVSSGLYFLVFWDSKLYGDASLQGLFILTSFWGWWQWLRGHGSDGHALHVRTLGPQSRWKPLLAFIISWPLIGLFLHRYTDTDVPWWDALPTAGSLIGQWLLGRKYLENWLAWLLVNVAGVTLFAYKGLWLTSVLYGIFAILSVVGWRAWRRLAV